MHGTTKSIDAARERAASTPLDESDVPGQIPRPRSKDPSSAHFSGSRKENPVHDCKDILRSVPGR